MGFRLWSLSFGGVARQKRRKQQGLSIPSRKMELGAMAMGLGRGAVDADLLPHAVEEGVLALGREKSQLAAQCGLLDGLFVESLSPSSRLRRAFVWSLSYLFYPCFYPSLQTQASVKQPLLTSNNNLTKDGRLPVIIFSHGMWACRTTYTSTCIDVASHGYTVEHLDGSAVIAQYLDHKGKRRWVEHAFSDVPFDDVPMSNRSGQLRQRVGEIEKTLAVLQALDQGLLPQECNVIKGRTSLDVKFLQGRLNFNYLGIHGHSFGAATAIAVCCVDKRFKCCVAEDVWWAPVEEGTSHMDQSDFPLLFAGALKRTGMGGKLDVRHAKDINSRASLDFFYENLLPPGTRAPYLVDVVKEDGEHPVVSKVPSSNASSVV